MNSLKVSIIMPTYNDEQYIRTSIDSVIAQTYSNWELLIMDDGSSDTTAEVVQSYSDKRIKLYQQSNQGQLNALRNLALLITGDLILLLHSDDRLFKTNSLEENLPYFDDPATDGIYCPLIYFYQSGKPDELQKITSPINNQSPAKLLALLGSNFIPDHFFIRKEKFLTHVCDNYLRWNVPYWLSFGKNKVEALHLKCSNSPWYYYRIYDGNYANSPIGCFELFLGRLRSVFLLSDYYTLPLPHIQKELIRRFNINTLKCRKSNINKNISKLIDLLIRAMKQRTAGAYTEYFEKLRNFYAYTGQRSIRLKSELRAEYFGGDSRKFFNDLKNGTLPPIYKEIIDQLNSGFTSIEVSNTKELEQIKYILKFLSIRVNVTL